MLTFIERGGSFAVGQVMEPFDFGVADIEIILVNMLAHNLTFAEAVWSALPVLSWQNIPVGDPLARITVTSGAELDRNADNRLDVEDLYVYEQLPQDHTCDGLVNEQDRIRLRDAVRTGEATTDVTIVP